MPKAVCMLWIFNYTYLCVVSIPSQTEENIKELFDRVHCHCQQFATWIYLTFSFSYENWKGIKFTTSCWFDNGLLSYGIACTVDFIDKLCTSTAWEHYSFIEFFCRFCWSHFCYLWIKPSNISFTQSSKSWIFYGILRWCPSSILLWRISYHKIFIFQMEH